MRLHIARSWILPTAIVAAFGTFACSDSNTPVGPSAADSSGSGSTGSAGGNSAGSGSTNGGSAHLTIGITDSPFSDAKAVLITFDGISVHTAGQGWQTVSFANGATERTCDLKKLTSAQDVLGSGPLPVGHYTQIRLVVANATIYFDNASSGTACAPSIVAPSGRSAPVDVASGDIRLNREFGVTSMSTTTITLDFDGDQSVKQTGTGSYLMTPVIGIVSVQ